MVQTASGLYAIQAGLATADAFNNSPEILPIGIAIMAILAIAVAGTIYMLKKLFSARRVTDDVSASLPFLSGSAGVMATQTSKDLSIGNDKVTNKGR
jgi:cytochrome d ubiquinol oxidase subunit I